MSSPFVTIPQPPSEPYRSAAWIAEQVFCGLVTARWVLENCPRVQLSRYKVVFLESKVRAWADARMGDAA